MAKRRKFSSYTEQKDHRYRILRVIGIFIAFFLLYTVLSDCVISIRVLKNSTMQPSLHPGDRYIFSSQTFYRLLSEESRREVPLPFKRGQVVLVDMALEEDLPLGRRLLDALIRFCTAQRISLRDQEDRFFVKRMVALPGDEISMTGYVLRVRPQGESYAYTEFERSDRPYEIIIPQVPALWDHSLPFSGNFDPIVLEEGECFLLSDDRSVTSDSRSWGPISTRLISGRALFRIWPLLRMGRP
jgi:signal peptidase I